MKILALVTDAFGGYGGIARYNCALLSALAELPEVESIRILARQGPAGRFEDVSAKLSAGRSIASAPLYSCVALAEAARLRPDLVFCGHLYMAPLAVALKRLLGLPFWLQLHGVEVWQDCPPIRLRAAGHAEMVTAVSRHTRAEFLKRVRIAAHKVRVLPNTFEAGFHAADADNSQRSPSLISVARLDQYDRYKGIDTVIGLMPSLLAEFPDLNYRIVGEGNDRARLEALARESGVSERVVFTGKVSDAELQDLYRQSKVFVLPSRKEGFGIVFLEAAASGCRVVGGRHDGSVDALADGQIGEAVNLDGPGELLSALRRNLLADAPLSKTKDFDRFAAGRFQQHLGALLEGLSAGM